jgi:hypothetical protein
MATLIDTSLWIDFTRVRSPRSIKRFVAFDASNQKIANLSNLQVKLLQRPAP